MGVTEVRIPDVCGYSGDFVSTPAYAVDVDAELLLLRFDEGAENVACDSSGHGYRFGVVGTQWSADQPAPVLEPITVWLLALGSVPLVRTTRTANTTHAVYLR